MTWQNLLDTASLTIDEIKERLPLEWVVAEADVVLEKRADGRLVGACPFHPDENPSFAIFGDNYDRVGCWSCDFSNGDLIDFIQRWKATGFKEAIKEAIKLLRQFEALGGAWVPSPPPDRAPVDPETLAQAGRDALRLASYDLTPLQRVIAQKGIPITAEWLHREFLVGAQDQDSILVPHLVRDSDGDLHLTGYKTRTPMTHLWSASGSKFVDLYAGWRDQGRDEIILCEGESDTWLLTHTFVDMDVVGLPAGANQALKPEWVDRFRHRDVVILMDADTPGRGAASRWHETLLPLARSVRVASLEDGADACSTELNLLDVVNHAVEVPLWTGQVILANTGTHYVRQASGVAICNWALRPERLIEMDEGGSAIEGVIIGTNQRVVITSEDVASEGNVRRWSNKHDRVWLGSTKDAQSLWELLLRVGPFLARGEGTYVAGWHDNHVVIPDHTIGPRHWVYVQPASTPAIDRMVARWNGYTDSESSRRALLAGLTLHDPDVVSPIIAWMAAAPVRSLFNVFPPLAVVGAAGGGKTTIVSELLQLFGWSGQEYNITSTTPYGVTALGSAVNGIPLWFDEYRARGARRDTKEAFEQLLRDAWTGSSSTRGGLQTNNPSALTVNRALAPLIVSGEDMFSQTSHGERLIIVQVPHQGRNVAALEYLRGPGRHHNLGPTYLTWLVEQAQTGLLPSTVLPQADRPTQGKAVLEWGWETLGRYCGEVLNQELPELDLTTVDREREDVLRIPSVLDAVAWALSELDRKGKPLAWVEGEDVLVRVRALVAELQREPVIELPGGERATLVYLKQTWDVKSYRTTYGVAHRLFGARETLERLGIDE